MNKIKINLVLVLVGLLVLGFTGVTFAEELFVKDGVRIISGLKWAPDEIVVKFKRGVSDDVIRGINQRHGTSVLSISKRGQFKRLRIPKNKTVEEMVAIYSRNPNIEYAEPNYIAHAFMVPNDLLYSYQWHLDNAEYGGINMESAWDIETGDWSVIVAVIDTGVAYEDYQPSRKEKYYLAPDLADTNFVDGYDFVNDDAHPNDDEGHGTHVTGTIAQSTNNNLGVAGVAFNCSIMPIKVLDKRGSGTYADVADGIYFAADNGADVINLSLGGPGPSETLEGALDYAYGKGVTIVCAAGNEYEEGNAPSYPAAYDAYCIAVGATAYDEARAYYSNTGSYLDIAAPGGDIYADLNGDGYADGVLQQTFDRKTNNWGYWFYQGTSMAAPHVSGVAALLIANGTTGPANIKQALEATAEDKDPAGWDPEYGAGIVDAYAALNYTSVPVYDVYDVAVTNISAPSQCLQGDIVSVTVSVANQGDFSESFTVTLTDTTDNVVIGSELITLSAGAATDVLFDWDTSAASIDDHSLKAEASVVSGETETADNTMTTTVTVKEPSNDVAIIAIDAPAEAYQGDTVSVSVTVENQGTYSEKTTVTLTDTTDNVIIGSEPITLSAGATTDVPFDWDTSAASIDDHSLKAEASVVSGETDLADNSMTTITTINEKPVGQEMHISDITVELKKAGPNYQGKAYVTIEDASGIVSEATVTGDWTYNGNDLNTASNTTNGDGIARLGSDKIRGASSGDIFRITITNVTKDGYTYDPDSNVEISDFVTVP